MTAPLPHREGQEVVLLLSLHSTAGITFGECFHFVDADVVEVAWDSVFEGRGGYGKLEGFALRGLGEQAVDKSARE